MGQVTSGGYGYTVARSIAYAYLPVGDVRGRPAVAGTASGAVAVAVDGEWVEAEVPHRAVRPHGNPHPRLTVSRTFRHGESAFRHGESGDPPR